MSYDSRDDHRNQVSTGTSRPILVRALVTLLFMFGFSLAQPVLFALAVIQLLWMFLKGERNAFIADFGHALAAWLAETALFLTGASDERPFPFGPWPGV
jgi:hypothetical protein